MQRSNDKPFETSCSANDILCGGRTHIHDAHRWAVKADSPSTGKARYRSRLAMLKKSDGQIHAALEAMMVGGAGIEPATLAV
jgi:hypothetical protein